MGINVQKTVPRWSCCFAPKQFGLPKLFNQSSAIWLRCYEFGGKDTTSISANFCCCDTDALLKTSKHVSTYHFMRLSFGRLQLSLSLGIWITPREFPKIQLSKVTLQDIMNESFNNIIWLYITNLINNIRCS